MKIAACPHFGGTGGNILAKYSALYYLELSHFWLATPQEVLQADWQEVWHSPQPPFSTLFAKSRVSRVLILFIFQSPLTILLLIIYTKFLLM